MDKEGLAFAVAFHAKPRYTKDIDILVEPTIENGERIVLGYDELIKSKRRAGRTMDKVDLEMPSSAKKLKEKKAIRRRKKRNQIDTK